MNRIQASRCLTLAWYLKTEVPRGKYDQNYWGASDCEKNAGKVGSQASLCGTSACALGWATNIWPEKLRLSFSEGADIIDGVFVAKVQFRLENSWVALDAFGSDFLLQDFFGLSPDEITDVFGKGDSTPKQKAKQIEKIVGKYGWTYA